MQNSEIIQEYKLLFYTIFFFFSKKRTVSIGFIYFTTYIYTTILFLY